jgi:hypothetical protein
VLARGPMGWIYGWEMATFKKPEGAILLFGSRRHPIFVGVGSIRRQVRIREKRRFHCHANMNSSEVTSRDSEEGCHGGLAD